MDWETSFATYINPVSLCGCECCLVAALACSFSKSTRVSLTCKRYGSLLTRVSHLSSLPTDYHRFLKTILANGVKEGPKIQSLKFSSQTGIEPGTFVLVVRCTNHYTTALLKLNAAISLYLLFLWFNKRGVYDIQMRDK